jgi:hypothetical protein
MRALPPLSFLTLISITRVRVHAFVRHSRAPRQPPVHPGASVSRTCPSSLPLCVLPLDALPTARALPRLRRRRPSADQFFPVLGPHQYLAHSCASVPRALRAQGTLPPCRTPPPRPPGCRSLGAACVRVYAYVIISHVSRIPCPPPARCSPRASWTYRRPRSISTTRSTTTSPSL